MKATLIWLLYVSLLAKRITKWAVLKMSVQIGSGMWAVMSAATCFFLCVVSSAVRARLQGAELILSALRVHNLETFYRSHKGFRRWWCQCNLKSELQGWPKRSDTDKHQTMKLCSAVAGLKKAIKFAHHQLQGGCYRPQTRLMSPWGKRSTPKYHKTDVLPPRGSGYLSTLCLTKHLLLTMTKLAPTFGRYLTLLTPFSEVAAQL